MRRHARRHALSFLTLVALVTTFRSIVACGCGWTPDDVRITPGEPCVVVETHVCTPKDQTITLTNHCAVPLDVERPNPVESVPYDASVVEPQTLASNDSLIIDTSAYDDGENHIVVPAKLGDTAIYITFEIKD